MEELIYQGSAEDEEKVLEILERSTRKIVEKVGTRDCDAVVLTGGFGRGEGAVKRNGEEPGAPFNDLDLLLIGARARVSASVLRELKNSLPRIAGTDFVDVGYLHSSEFRKAAPTIFLYDLRNGSRVIWGDEAVLEKIPSFSSSELPMSEATRLFLNRGIGLLYAYLLLARGEARHVLEKTAAVAWSKTVLAAGDAKLLQRRIYHWSYVERMKRIEEAAKSSAINPDFLENYKRAALFKLTADFGVLPARDPSRLCRDARIIHEEHFRQVEQRRTRLPMGDWREYPSVLLRAGLDSFRRRLKQVLIGLGSSVNHPATLTRFVRLPLLGEERRLALLPLVLYSAPEPGGREDNSKYLEEACVLEFGRRRAVAEDWSKLAGALVGDSHP